jgi:DNA-binding Lrp family transcriptional regulator
MNRTADHQLPPVESYIEPESEGPGVADAARFLYQRRLKLLARFLVLFSIGLVAVLYGYLASSKTVEGVIGLKFQGIEKRQYPSGREFTVEDFRSPEILSQALADADISPAQISLRDLAAHVIVTPVVPAEVQNRWKKQDRDGVRREAYIPNEFKIGIDIGGLTNAQRIRLFDAVVERYRRRIKADQESALSFVSQLPTAYEKLAVIYDLWDIPGFFRETCQSLTRQLDSLIIASSTSPDSKWQLSFREIAKDLDIWDKTRLEALEALTYEGGLVRNRDIITQRVGYQIADLDVQIQQKKQEANEALRLIEIASRPGALLAGQLSNKEGLPLVDASALDRLIKSDYIGPVVKHISKLQGEVQALEAQKARFERQLTWLPKAKNIDLNQLPRSYRELIEILGSELNKIIQSYNHLLDVYLADTVTSLVVVIQSPVITRGGYSPVMLLVGVFFLSAFLAVAILTAEHIFKQARQEQS